jgi:hypothetical protein
MKATEGRRLILDEIGPCSIEVIEGRKLLFPISTKLNVLVDVIHRAQVTEVPVELRTLFRGIGCDERHHNVAAVAGVSGNGKLELGGGY